MRTGGDALTEARVAIAALAVVDRDGLDALSPTAVAAETGSPEADVAELAADGAALRDLTIVNVMMSVDGFADPAAGWPAQLTAFAGRYRAALLAHPNLAVAVTMRPLTPDIGRRLFEGLIGRMVMAGFTMEQGLFAMQSVGVYVNGHALAQIAAERAASPQPQVYFDAWFEAGLAALVRGFERRG